MIEVIGQDQHYIREMKCPTCGVQFRFNISDIVRVGSVKPMIIPPGYTHHDYIVCPQCKGKLLIDD